MSEDTEKHRASLSARRVAQGKGDGSFDQAVTNAFAHVFEHLGRLNDHVSLGGPQLLQPDRFTATLASLWAGRVQKAAEVDGRDAALRTEVRTAEDKLKRLYGLIGDGITELDDILRDRLAGLKSSTETGRARLLTASASHDSRRR